MARVPWETDEPLACLASELLAFAREHSSGASVLVVVIDPKSPDERYMGAVRLSERDAVQVLREQAFELAADLVSEQEGKGRCDA